VDGIVAVWASEDATSQLALPSDTVSAAVMAGMPSSVIDVTGAEPAVLRAGPDADALATLLR